MKQKLQLITFLLLLAWNSGNAQDDNMKPLFDLAGKSGNWYEGFQKNTGSNEFNYHSFRNDVSNSLITRCTSGSMEIEWETAAIPETSQQKETGFLWIAALDLTSEKVVFDVFINGTKRFEVTSTEKKQWQINTNDGASLSFVTVETDQNNDAHGYMNLVAPVSWLNKGKSQKIKIVGRANNSNVWIIVYQATDALAYLQNSIEHDVWMELVFEENSNQLTGTINAPFYLAGKQVTYSTENQKKTIQLHEKDGFATGEFKLPLSAKNKMFTLNDTKGEVFVVQSLGAPLQSTKLLSKAVLLNESTITGEKIQMSAKRNYKPNTVSSLLKLSNSK